MMDPVNTDLLKHKADRHTPPTAHEREANRARRAAFLTFIAEVFTQAPRHASPAAEPFPLMADKHAL